MKVKINGRALTEQELDTIVNVLFKECERLLEPSGKAGR